MLLPDMMEQIDKDWKAIRENMTVGNADDADDTRRPSSTMMFAWQGPTMCLSYSLVAFMGGLMSVVFSPWAQNMMWGPEAKVRFRRSIWSWHGRLNIEADGDPLPYCDVLLFRYVRWLLLLCAQFRARGVELHVLFSKLNRCESSQRGRYPLKCCRVSMSLCAQRSD